MNLTDTIVVNYFYSKKIDNKGRRRFYSNLWKECQKNENNEYYQYLLNRFSDSDDAYESLFRLRYEIYERPVCNYCGGHVKFTTHHHYPYLKYCSKECEHNDIDNIKEKMRQTFNEKYGGVGAQSNIIKNKMKEGCLRKHGVEYAGQIPEQKEKSKETCLKKYGVIYASQAQEVKDKIKQTYISHFGVDTPMKIQSIKNKKENTMKYRYGYSQAMQVPEIKKKRSDTCLKRYGFKYASQAKKVKDKMKDTCLEKYGVSSTCLLSRGPKSNEEDKLYEILITKFGKTNVERNKRDNERYPYHCDFYIKSLDLFIEYNGHEFTHWHHPFDKTNIKDIKRLNSLKEHLDSEYYRAAIKCWTERDPEKRMVAKINQLNYVELWSFDEAIEFIKSL